MTFEDAMGALETEIVGLLNAPARPTEDIYRLPDAERLAQLIQCATALRVAAPRRWIADGAVGAWEEPRVFAWESRR